MLELKAGESIVMQVLPGHTLTVTNDGWTMRVQASKLLSIKPIDERTIHVCETGELTDEEMP